MNFQSMQFGFNKSAKRFVAEVSELTGNTVPLFNRASRCLTVKSHRTGAIETFRLQHIETDADQDVVFWDFAPINPDNEITVRIFND